MNIVREQREQNTSLIRVTVGEQDYGEAVEKSLREYKRKANIPGFRPGMVPMGIVKKMYGKGVLAEQSYRTASNAVFEYLQKENIDYLGDVIPSEEQGDFDFENGTEFEFVFEIGEAPAVGLALSKEDKLTYNAIAVEKKMHDDYRANYLRQYFVSSLMNPFSDYPYPGSTCRGEFITMANEEKLTIYDNGTSLSIGYPGKTPVMVNAEFGYLPFAYGDGCLHFIDGIL